MHIVAIGMNHNTAPVDLRECVAVAPADLPAALARLVALPGVVEGAILSTCNRTELYVATELPPERADLERYLADQKDVTAAALRPHLYFHENLGAAAHLFRVAAGLDAMVIGETQILGQVRDAYQTAVAQHTAGKFIHHLLSAALAAGKRAQAETGIGQNAVSISYAAVELVKKLFQGLGQRTVLAIGAGETAKLTVRHLVSAGARRILVANRTLARAQRLADRIGGEPLTLDQVAAVLPQVDVVISSTGAPGFVVTRPMVQDALRQRRGRPIFIFDIAVPRDIDPQVGRLDGAFLYDIDDLQQVVNANMDERMKEARRAERILQEELAEFQKWFASQAVVPTIRLLREKIETIRLAELQRALQRLPDLSDREKGIIEAMSAAIVNKILNDPTQRLKGLAAEGEAGPAAAAVALLFGLAQGPERSGTAEMPAMSGAGESADAAPPPVRNPRPPELPEQ